MQRSYRNLVQSIGDTIQESGGQVLRGAGVIVEVHLGRNGVSCLERARRSQLRKGQSVDKF
jgi:hypothetical protein